MRPFIVLSLLSVGFAVGLTAQTAMTNDDVVKLAKSGLSEEFILNMIQQQPSRFSTDVSRLIDLKRNGVSERVISAVAKKTPPQERLTSYGLIELVKAQFSDNFVLDLINGQPSKFSVDAARIVELKQAGVSERILSAIVGKSANRELPAGTEISVRLIDEIDSEKAKEGDQFKASLDEQLTLDNEVIAPRGADAVVRLSAEKQSGKITGRAELTVELVSVTISGRPVPVNSTSVSQTSGSRGSRTAKTAAVTGAIGAIIGGIAGGGKGAAIGAGVGAGAGAGSQVFMKGQRVKIPSETVLHFTAEQPVKLTS